MTGRYLICPPDAFGHRAGTTWKTGGFTDHRCAGWPACCDLQRCFCARSAAASYPTYIPRAEAGRAGLLAWEVSSATHGLRAQTLICGILDRLATSDRE